MAQTFGPWQGPYGPFRQGDLAYRNLPGFIDDRGYQELYSLGFARGGATAASYTLSESLAALSAGTHPWDDLNGRLCAVDHAANAQTITEFNWDPGECEPLSDVGYIGSITGGLDTVDSGLESLNVGLTLGLTSSYNPSPLPLTPGTFNASVRHAYAGFDFLTYEEQAVVSYDPELLYYRSVHPSVLLQVPGWEEGVLAAPFGLHDWLEAEDYVGHPQVRIENVDATIQLVGRVQDTLGAATTISLHTRSDPLGALATPYPDLGGAVASVPATSGAESSTITVPAVHAGARTFWDLSSSWIGNDPGPSGVYQAKVWARVDFHWTVSIRFPGEQPLRWRQRDDGLGVGAARRHRGGTSVQGSLRHRGYR